MMERDYKVVDFVTKLPCYSDTIQKLFYPSQRVANRRLAFLHDYLYLRRSRHGASDKYFYYANKEPSKRSHVHYDYIARTYNWVKNNGYKINGFEVQKQCGKVIPDLLLDIEKNGKRGMLAVEVELSNNNVVKKIKKYEDCKEFKKLLLVSKMDVNSKVLDIIKINPKELP